MATGLSSLLFALPGEDVFRRTQPVHGLVVRSGRMVAEPYRLDAELARSLLPRLVAIRARFETAAGKPDIDPMGLLPYWMFAADTLIMAARRLAAFGHGSRSDAEEHAALDKDFRALRRRFVRLWNARNRPSEIGIVLARYDRVIRGESVFAELASTGSNRVRLTLTNAGVRLVTGTVTLTAAPYEVVRFSSPAEMTYTRLRPGASCQAEFALETTERNVPLTIRALGSGAGFSGAALTMYPERDWAISRLEPASAFRLSGEIVPAPEIEVAAVEAGPEGYTLAALIPLSLLCLEPDTRAFLLDGAVTACTAGRTEHRRATLFFATENAFRDSAGYGCLRVL